MDKPWHICASNAVTGEGLNEAREIDVKSDYYYYKQIFHFLRFILQGVEWLTGQIKDGMDGKR